MVCRQNTKRKCVQMFPKKVYICFVNIQIKLVVIGKEFIYCKTCSRSIVWLKVKKIITQILFLGHLIKFILIIVPTSQVQKERFILGLGSHLSIQVPFWMSCSQSQKLLRLNTFSCKIPKKMSDLLKDTQSSTSHRLNVVSSLKKLC